MKPSRVSSLNSRAYSESYIDCQTNMSGARTTRFMIWGMGYNLWGIMGNGGKNSTTHWQLSVIVEKLVSEWINRILQRIMRMLNKPREAAVIMLFDFHLVHKSSYDVFCILNINFHK